ncbi:hypothetical protein NKR19_g1397 [Coniochaeta hoffmannii]|uniref:DUF8212 domain-containing protein n=1 Tax=Coniochaeta hoffmannii TaxID=91930 RepID=A0AA38SII2_9PEZI|nr:hypothetical protein NKR19_g1397 [Coniochaeta hoffmannii]
MPMLYGEGAKAFLRLQEEIVKRTNDLSLLAWKNQAPSVGEHGCGVLASSPSAFRCSGGFSITTQLHIATAKDRHPFYILHLADNKDLDPVYLVLLKLDRDLYVRDCSSMYLAHDPGRRYGAEAVYKKRCGSIDLGIPAGSGRGIKVFDEVIPESVWDPTQFLLLDPSTPVALLLGDPKEPYGSVYLLDLKHRTAGTLYLVPASSRAIPYIMTNLGNLTQQTLLAFFNLEPVQLDRLEIKTRPHNHLFQGEDLSAGGLRFDLLALFREV